MYSLEKRYQTNMCQEQRGAWHDMSRRGTCDQKGAVLCCTGIVGILPHGGLHSLVTITLAVTFFGREGERTKSLTHYIPTDAQAIFGLQDLFIQWFDAVKHVCVDVALNHVMQVERSTKRLNLGLKPRYFEGDADSSDEESGDEERQNGNGSDDGSSDDDSDDEDEMDAMVAAAAMDVSDDEGEESQDEDDGDEDEESDDDEEEEEESSRSLKRARGVLGEGLGGANGAGGANAFSLNFGDLGSMGGAAASSDEDEDSDDDSDGDTGASG